MSSVVELNHFCHKNRLSFNFKLIKAEGPAHDKIFNVCLYIKNPWSEKQCCLEFYGKGKSIKKANVDAAENALSKNLIDLLGKTENSLKKELDSSFDSNFSLNINEEKTTEINDLETKLFNAYSMAEQLNLFFEIDLVWVQENFNKKLINVIITIDSKTYPGSGSTDIEAIYDAIQNANSFFVIDKEGKKNFHQEIDKNFLEEINILSQRSKKNLEFNLILQIGIRQTKFVIYKCTFGQQIEYGIGKNKKIAKNKAAKKIMNKIEADEYLELIKMETCGINQEEPKKEKTLKNYDKIFSSGLDAISILHVLDSNRQNPSLDFTYKKEQIDQNIYFTVECFLLYGIDLKKSLFPKENLITRNNLSYIRTTSTNSKKKKAKMEAAEKMVNLLQGKPAKLQTLLGNFDPEPEMGYSFE